MLKELWGYRKSIISLINSIKDNITPFLQNGTYIFDYRYSILYRKTAVKLVQKESGNHIANFHRAKENKLKKFFEWLFIKSLRFKIDSKTKISKGVICNINNRQKQVKIFDCTEKKLITKYLDDKSFAINVRKRKKLSDANFPVPKCIYHKTEKYIIEKYYTRSDCDHIKLFEEMLDNFINNRVGNKTAMLIKTKQAIESEKFFSNFDNGIYKDLYKKFLTDKSYVKIISHGDLSYLNIINTEKKGFYLIDYETVDYHIFFFDVFYYLYFELYRFDNKEVAKLLFAGYFDKKLSLFFSNYNQKYDRKLLKMYFYITLTEYYGFNLSDRHLNVIKNATTTNF